MALIITIGVAFRAAAINGFSPEIVSDSLSYVSMALNLIERNEIVDHMGNYAMYSVGYPLFVLAPVFFVFGKSIIGAQFLHLILGGISIAICYMVAKEAGAGRCGRLLAAIIWALYLPASVYGVYIAKENLMVPLMLGIAWCALRLLKEPSPKVAIGCGILLGLIALTGNAALSLVVSVIFALLLTPASLRQRLKLFCAHICDNNNCSSTLDSEEYGGD